MKNQKGMTLLELILALSMLSILTVGLSSFASGIGRWSLSGGQDLGMQSDYDHVLSKIEAAAHDFAGNHQNISMKLKIESTPHPKTELQLVAAGSTDQLTFVGGLENGSGYIQIKSTLAGVPKTEVLMSSRAVLPSALSKQIAPAPANLASCLTDFGATNCGYASCLDDGFVQFNDATCNQNAFFPFFEASADGSIIYVSFQNLRTNSTNGLSKKMGVPLTKAIYLNRTVGRQA